MKKTDTDKFFEQERLGIFYIRHIHRHSNSVIQPICPQVELRGLGLKAMGGGIKTMNQIKWRAEKHVLVEHESCETIADFFVDDPKSHGRCRLAAEAPMLLEACQRLLGCTELNLDDMEPGTREAIQFAANIVTPLEDYEREEKYYGTLLRKYPRE